MAKIKPEDTHMLLEKLVEYVMSEVPTKKDMNSKFEQVDSKFAKVNSRFDQIENRLASLEEKKADKKDVQNIINILDKQAKQLDDLKTEHVATNSALLRHEERITDLEQKVH
jgi:hypothetical protein